MLRDAKTDGRGRVTGASILPAQPAVIPGALPVRMQVARLRCASPLLPAVLLLLLLALVVEPATAQDWHERRGALLNTGLERAWDATRDWEDAADIWLRDLIWAWAPEGGDFRIILLNGGEFELRLHHIDNTANIVTYRVVAHDSNAFFNSDIRGTLLRWEFWPVSGHHDRAYVEISVHVESTLPAATSSVQSYLGGFAAAMVNQGRLALGSVCDTDIRSYDGSCNNIYQQDIGAAGTEFRRLVTDRPPVYQDDCRVPFPLSSSVPGARVVSNHVMIQNQQLFGAAGVSDLFVAFGQFIDHDVTLTPSGTDDFITSNGFLNPWAHSIGAESMGIAVPEDDPLLSDFSIRDSSHIKFFRSVYKRTNFAATCPRQQTNHQSAWLDLSQVYGPDPWRIEHLRAGYDGQMRLDDVTGMPPFNTVDDLGFQLDNAPTSYDGASAFYALGDVRGNEAPVLTALHVVWLREHNRVADELMQLVPESRRYDDEYLFQLARRIVTSEYQAIVYREWLPALLGPNDVVPHYDGYNSNVDGRINNFFAAVAFRFGHSLVNQHAMSIQPDRSCQRMRLDHALFQMTLDNEDVAAFLLGATAQRAQELDVHVIDELRNALFSLVEPEIHGVDLAAANIQRARDHGSLRYNEAREAYGLTRKHSILAVCQHAEVAQRIIDVYGDDPDSLDAFIGAVCEAPAVSGGMLGPLLRAAVLDQFARLRDADRFFYRRLDWPRSIEDSYPHLQAILSDEVSLRDVIARNTPLATTDLPDLIFHAVESDQCDYTWVDVPRGGDSGGDSEEEYGGGGGGGNTPGDDDDDDDDDDHGGGGGGGYGDDDDDDDDSQRDRDRIHWTTGDTMLIRDWPFSNQGANSRLAVNGNARTIVKFDHYEFEDYEEVEKAVLELHVVPGSVVGTYGAETSCHPLYPEWEEGDGKTYGEHLSSWEKRTGSGYGATWSCAVDWFIENDRANCHGTNWDGGWYGEQAGPDRLISRKQYNGAWHEVVAYDVTDDVHYGISQWLVRLTDEESGEKVEFESRNGANLLLRPKLRLTYKREVGEIDPWQAWWNAFWGILGFLGIAAVFKAPRAAQMLRQQHQQLMHPSASSASSSRSDSVVDDKSLAPPPYKL